MSITLTIIFLVLFFIIFSLYFTRFLHSDKTLKHLRAQIDRLLIEVNQVSDQNITLLDDRINALKELLQQADTVIAEAKKATDVLVREKKRQLEHAERYVAIQKSAIETVSTTKRTGDVIPPALPSEPTPAAPQLDKKQKILQLSKSGQNAESIAAQLGIARAEVELVLSLSSYN